MEKQIRPTSEEIHDAIKVRGEIEEEVYFGFNLGIVLSEATQEERDTIKRIMRRAKKARNG